MSGMEEITEHPMFVKILEQYRSGHLRPSPDIEVSLHLQQMSHEQLQGVLSCVFWDTVHANSTLLATMNRHAQLDGQRQELDEDVEIALKHLPPVKLIGSPVACKPNKRRKKVKPRSTPRRSASRIDSVVEMDVSDVTSSDISRSASPAFATPRLAAADEIPGPGLGLG